MNEIAFFLFSFVFFFTKRNASRSSAKSSSFNNIFTQLILFVAREKDLRVHVTVDDESMMTCGLVGWCFSRRTHRRGRMITCRARAARCTRKPSPRPLPGWHFPKPASKFSLSTAVTHVTITDNKTTSVTRTHTEHVTRYMKLTTIRTHSCEWKKKRKHIMEIYQHKVHSVTNFFSVFFSLFFYLLLHLYLYSPFIPSSHELFKYTKQSRYRDVHTYICTYITLHI